MDNEFHYQLTSDMNQHVRVYLGSLEIPTPQTIIDPHESSSTTVHSLRSSTVRLFVTLQLRQPGTTRSTQVIRQRSKLSKTGRDARSGSLDRHHHHVGLHAPQSTVHEWGEWLTLPIRYNSLPRSAELNLKIWTLDGRLIGQTSLHVFHHSSVMRAGIQKLLVYSGEGKQRSATGSNNFRHGRNQEDSEDSEDSEEDSEEELDPPLDGYISDDLHDVRFRQRRLREQYANGEMIRVKWLDRAAEAYEQALSYKTTSPHPTQPKIGVSPNHACFHSHPCPIFLYIELPKPRHTVLYNEKLYDDVYASSQAADGVSGEGEGSSGSSGSSSGSSSSSSSTARGHRGNRSRRDRQRRRRSGSGTSNLLTGTTHAMSMDRW